MAKIKQSEQIDSDYQKRLNIVKKVFLMITKEKRLRCVQF